MQRLSFSVDLDQETGSLGLVWLSPGFDIIGAPDGNPMVQRASVAEQGDEGCDLADPLTPPSEGL